MKDHYQAELVEIKDNISRLEEEYKNYSAKGSQKQEWVERLKQGQGVNELDRGLISFLIDRIEVFEGGRLWIKYRFAADFEDYLLAGW